jgi:hypothetical protein
MPKPQCAHPPAFRAALCAAVFAVTPAAAQHDQGSGADSTETFRVEGLRIDPEDPPPGSAVGRAGARLPGGGYLHVVYGKPYKRGRQVFGGLVGYGQVWVTGAHHATELVVTVPVTVGGEPLEPGTYSLFTTPQPDRWTLHLNRALGMHLADEYAPTLDVLVVDLAPEVLAETVEAFTIDFVPATGGADLRIRWDRTGISVPIRARP